VGLRSPTGASLRSSPARETANGKRQGRSTIASMIREIVQRR
jgi:hypothetical protein